MTTLAESRIIAFDYGEKRIGIAITDPLNIFAYPLITLNNDSLFWQNLKKIFSENKISKIILGLPVKESGAESIIKFKVLAFKDELEKKFAIDVLLVDERYSSSIAQRRILETVSSKKKRKDKFILDKNAAAVLLEDYLRRIA